MQLRNITRSIRFTEIVNNIAPYLGPNDKVLDIGCDTGFITEKINQAFGCLMFGTDIENRLANKMIPWVRLADGKIETNLRFTVVLLIDTLHHVPYGKQAAIIQEAKRVAETVIIWESEPSWIVRLTDWTQRNKMPCPGAYRTKVGWWWWTFIYFRFKLIKVKRSWYYPIKHCMFIWRRKDEKDQRHSMDHSIPTVSSASWLHHPPRR